MPSSNILNNFSDKRGKIPPRKHKSQKIPRPAQAQENAARMRKMLQKLILQQSQPQQKAEKGSLPEADASPSLLIPAAFRRDNPIALLQQVTWHRQPHKQHTLVGSSCWLCRGFRAAGAFGGRVASPCSGCPEGGSRSGVPAAKASVLQACLQFFFLLFKRAGAVKLHSSFYTICIPGCVLPPGCLKWDP